MDLITLRAMMDDDLPVFFKQMQEEDGIQMAGFTPKYPFDKQAFNEKWEKIKADTSIIRRTILFNGEIAGHIARHNRFGEPEITYWIGKEFWYNGIASKALADFLIIDRERPLYARTAFDNFASQRVLEKCGFIKTGSEKGFANARSKEIEEYIFTIK